MDNILLLWFGGRGMVEQHGTIVLIDFLIELFKLSGCLSY